MAEPKNKKRLGHHMTYIADGNRGGECLAIRKNAETDQPITGGDEGQYVIVGEPTIVPVVINGAVATTGLPVFNAIGKSYILVDIEEVHTVAEATGATLNMKIERCQGTEAALAGDDLVAATAINAKGTANTLIDAAVITTSNINVFADGDRCVLHFAVDAETALASTEYRGTVTLAFVPVTLTNVNTV